MWMIEGSYIYSSYIYTRISQCEQCGAVRCGVVERRERQEESGVEIVPIYKQRFQDRGERDVVSGERGEREAPRQKTVYKYEK